MKDLPTKQPGAPLTPKEMAALDAAAERIDVDDMLAEILGTSRTGLAKTLSASSSNEANPPSALITPEGLTDCKAA